MDLLKKTRRIYKAVSVTLGQVDVVGLFCPVLVQSTSVFLKDLFNTAHLKTCSDVVGWTY